MGIKKDKPRELALMTLVSLDKTGVYTGNYLDDIFNSNPGYDERDRAFISNLIQGVIRWRLRLDWIIGGFSKTPVKKIDRVIINILRLAVYEMCLDCHVPASVVINEALEIARRYSTDDSVPFINGILDSMRKNIGNGEGEEEAGDVQGDSGE